MVRRFSKGWLPWSLAAGLQALPVAAQDAEIITKLEVVGDPEADARIRCCSRLGLKEGDDLRSIDLTEVLERLWATGAFDDIKFEVTDEPEGKKLTIRVKERPLVKEVDFRGGTVVGVSTIKDKIKDKKLTINPDSVYDPEATRKIKNLMVDLASEKGFPNPVVDVSLEPMGPTTSRLVFDIKEGGRVRIYRIKFRGNKVFSDSHLRSTLAKTKTHGMFSWMSSKDLVIQKNQEEDLDNIRNEYLEEGLQGRLRGQARHPGGRPHHRPAAEEEPDPDPAGQVPQVRPAGHPHLPRHRGGAVHGRALQAGRQRQGVPGRQGGRILPAEDRRTGAGQPLLAGPLVQPETVPQPPGHGQAPSL